LQRCIVGTARHIDSQQSGFFVACLCTRDGCWLAASRLDPMANFIVISRSLGIMFGLNSHG